MPRSEIAGSYHNSRSSKNLCTVFQNGCTNLHFQKQYRRVPFFSTPSLTFIICRLFNVGHSDCQSYGFSSSQVWMWELDHKEGWVPKNWCFLSVVLEKTLETPLDIKEIKSVNPKEYQPWIFIGRTDAKAESPVLWPPDMKNWLIGKDPDAGENWGQKEKGVTDDEMVRWHRWFNV